MADNTELLIRIRADTRQALSELRQVREGISGTGAAGDKAATGIKRVATETRDTTSAMRELRTQIIGVFAIGAIVQFGRKLVEAQVSIQRIQFTLQAATGSAKEAGEELQFVARISKQLGTNFQASAQGYARLAAAAKAANLPLSEQHDLFIALSRASSVLHLTQQDQQSALLAIEQSLSKGTIQAQELRLQLGQVIPGLVENFTKALGITGAQLNKLLQSGSLATNQVIPALIRAINDVAPDNALTESVKATNAEINRLHNAIFRAKVQLASGGFIEAITVGAKAIGDVGAAFSVTTDAAKNSGNAFSGVRTLILELGKGAAVASADIKGLGDEIGAVLAALQTIGGGADGKANSITDYIPGYNLITQRKKIGAILGGVNHDLTANYDQLKATVDKINELELGGGASAKQKPAAISDYAGQLKKERDKLQSLLSGKRQSGNSGLDTGIAAVTDAIYHVGEGKVGGGSGTNNADQKIQQIIASLKQQNATFGQSNAAIALYKLRLAGASKDQLQLAGALLGSIDNQKKATAARKADEQAAKQQAAAEAQFVAQIRGAIDPARQYRIEQEKLDAAYADGSLSAKEYAKATQLVSDKIAGLGKQTAQTDQFARKAAHEIQNAIAQAFDFSQVNNGIEGLVHNFAQAMQKIAAQALALQISDKLFGKGFGKTGSLGKDSLIGEGVSAAKPYLKEFASFAASFFHAGGAVAPGAGRMGQVPLAAFIGAPRFHQGTDILGLKHDEIPAVLQTGERVLSREQAAAAQAPQSVKVVLYDDRAKVADAMSSAAGEQVVMQHITRNADQVRHLIGGGS